MQGGVQLDATRRGVRLSSEHAPPRAHQLGPFCRSGHSHWLLPAAGGAGRASRAAQEPGRRPVCAMSGSTGAALGAALWWTPFPLEVSPFHVTPRDRYWHAYTHPSANPVLPGC